ncbi:MAG: AAA family ATPase, partial [Candidatus Micrarchaeota archaeon]|nr:AAA family ATPase [Candidatus Micrarchaeota archaeon]
MIIAISGTPGTGKTTIAKKLAKELGFEYVSLNELAEELNLYEDFDEKRNTKIVNIERISKEIEKRQKESRTDEDEDFTKQHPSPVG